jgi:uncharacterized protein YggU (UPF0235/DUF167 family)
MTKQRKFNLHHGKMGAAITVKVVPQSSRNEISEILKDGTIKVLLASQADESQTNQDLINYLAEVLQVAQKDLEIVGGFSGQDKLITILSLNPEMVQERIEKSLS